MTGCRTRSAILIPAAAMLLLVSLVFAPLSYHTLDEVILRSLLEGSFLGYTEVDPRYTLYPNILFSSAVGALHGIQPGIPWYDGITLLIGMVSVMAILWASLEGVERDGARLFRAALVLLLCYPVFLSPQFTLTAGLAALAGLMVAVTVAGRDRIHGRDYAALGFTLLALLVAGLVRYPVVQLMTLAMGLVFLPWGIRRLRHRPAHTLGVVAVVVLAIGGSVALQKLDRAAYRDDPALDAALRVGAAGLGVRNYALTRPAESVRRQIDRRLEENEIRPSTFLALRHSLYFNPDARDAGNAAVIADTVAPLVRRAANPGASLAEFATHLGYRVRGFLADPVNQLLVLPAHRKLESTHIVSGLTIVALLALALGIRRSGPILLVGILGIAMLYVAIALWLRIPPYRVYYLLILVVALRLLAETGTRRSATGALVALPAGALALALAVNQVHGHIRTGKTHLEKHHRIREVVEQFDPAHTYLVETAFLDHLLLPFRPQPRMTDLRILSGGWHSILPWYRDMMDRYGVTGEIEALCGDPRIRLVPAVRQSFRDGTLIRYLRLSAAERFHQVVREFKMGRAAGHPLHGCTLEDAP